jgi:RND superfamily putative drug exporter
VAVFAIFATLSSLEMKQLGVGLATAVLLDATLVRGCLLPSAMKLLGERNWYLPRWLGWLPQISLDGSAVGAVPSPRAGLEGIEAKTPAAAAARGGSDQAQDGGH